jgi:hypothetical protein
MSASRKKIYLPRMDEKSIADDAESLFNNVVFLVEADSYAQHLLWSTHFYNDIGLGMAATWEQEISPW